MNNASIAGNVAVIYRPSRSCLDISRHVVEILRNRGIRVRSFWVDDILRHVIGKVDLVVAIGGDGTLLKISRLFQDTTPLVFPIPCGRRKVFYEELEGDIEDYIERVLRGEFYVELLDRVKIYYDGKTYKVLNEAAFISRDRGRVIQIRVDVKTPTSISGFIFDGDGILVGPSSGSSAYHLSISGSLMDYYLRGFFVSPLNPMELNIKPYIVPPLSRATIEFINGYVETYIDGERKDTISPRKKVDVELDYEGFRIIRFGGKRNYVREVFEKRTTIFD